MEAPRRFGTVVFDCDSTLSAIEGVEELAGPHRAEVEALTEAAMRGDVPIEAVYGRRLELARPTRSRVERLGRRYIEALVPHAREVVAALRAERIGVRVVSAGLWPAVVALAQELGVPEAHVAAVDVYFDERGRYAGYDVASPLTAAGGKRQVIAGWLGGLERPVMMVGDGATDLEARPAVDLFVAYAGVIARRVVLAEADIVLRGASLAPVLALALGGEPPADAAARAVFDEGIRLLEPLRTRSALE